MLSKKAKYAIKALLALADHERDEPMRISDLARAEQIPPRFLELILLGLKNQGVLRSRKGKETVLLLPHTAAHRVNPSPLRHDDKLPRHRRLVRAARDAEYTHLVGREGDAMGLAARQHEILAERGN